MKKIAITAVVASLFAGTFAVVVNVVEAQQRRGGRRQAPQAEAPAPAPEADAPPSAALAGALGELRWGMSKADVYEFFTKKVRETYRPLLAKAPGAIEEDRLRARMQEELQRLRADEVCFEGRRTGWDVSFIQDEFTHNNNECLLVVNEADSQNFYFFINDRLWKWYKAFNAEMFQGQSFAQFSAAIQARFGESRERSGEAYPGAGQRTWFEWLDDRTRLRAVDQTQFYGFYCLVFDERQTVNNLATLRRNVPRRGTKTHSLVDLVTSQPTTPTTDDSRSDIVDRLTGKNRNPRQVAEPTKGQRPATTPTPATPNPSSDPLDL